MSQPITPRVFVSAVNSDLRTARKVVNEALTQIECLSIEESVFGTEYGPIRDMLRRRIASCQAVIHLVGRDYGGEPSPQPIPGGQPRRSWTQIECDLAKQLGKKLYIIVCDNAFPFDSHHSTESDEKVALQNDHRNAVLNSENLWHIVRRHDELRQRLLELKLPMDELRAELHGQRFRQRLHAGLAVAAISLLLAGVVVGLRQLGKQVDESGGQVKGIGEDVKEVGKGVASLKDEVAEVAKLYEDPDVLTGKLKSHIRKRAEEQIAEARKVESDWRTIDEIEKRRDQALDNVDELVATIREGLAGDPDPIFAEAARILVEGGVEEALAYLESKQPEIDKRVNSLESRRDRAEEKLRGALQPWLLKAELHKTNLQWGPTLKLYETVAEKAPEWSRARLELGDLLLTLANFPDAEPHLVDALEHAADDAERSAAIDRLAMLYYRCDRFEMAEPLFREALEIDERLHGVDSPDTTRALHNLASFLTATARPEEAEPLVRRALSIDERSFGPDNLVVAKELNNLALVLQDTNRLAEAEPLMRRVLAIVESSFGTEHPNVARALDSLAMLLQATDRVETAKPLMCRALTIDERSYGPAHPKVASDLNNLAMYFKLTNRLAEAEPLYRRALVIDEQSYGPEHSKVAIRLNNLALLLQDTNRLLEAEPLLRRALAIDERSYGSEHAAVATGLNNLAWLLRITNRLKEAEPLMRRAFAIDERSYGPLHPKVATDLNNLAQLLHATNRLAEAEPLMRRCISIFHQSAQTTGHEHRHMQASLEYYNYLLASLDFPPDEIQQRLRFAVPEPLEPITAEIERLLGPAKPVNDVLAALDQIYKAEGRPVIYFLPPGQPIVPYLNELLKPRAEILNLMGVTAYGNGAHADAVVLFEESLKLNARVPEGTQEVFATKTNRASALLELGAVEQARKALRQLLSEIKLASVMPPHTRGHFRSTPALTQGRIRYFLALCEWRLGDHEAAKREGDESLKAYAKEADQDYLLENLKEQTQQLLADLKLNKPPSPVPNVDAPVELKKARARFQAREILAALRLDQPAVPHLEPLLGRAKSTKEVLDALDAEYREQGKPAIWFLPLDEPISPHLDELLGPFPNDARE